MRKILPSQILVFVLLFSLAGPAARAGAKDDHERARAAVLQAMMAASQAMRAPR